MRWLALPLACAMVAAAAYALLSHDADTSRTDGSLREVSGAEAGEQIREESRERLRALLSEHNGRSRGSSR